MKPGYYVSRQGDADFGQALALIAAGEAESVGDIYDPDGTRVVAIYVHGDVRRNEEREALGTVGVRLGSRFFSNVLRDYESNFGEKWWREAIQNAVDAGAKNVTCKVEPAADDNWMVSCEDDGGGMDQDTLVRAMLTLGGSTKEEGTSTFGGFGRAKELLLLPWLEYTINTRDLSYTSHNDVPSTLFRAPMRKGTRLAVLMPGDRYATAEEAISYIRRCRLPRVNFTVNGERVVAELGKGTKKIREFDYEKDGRPFKAKVYTDPKDTNYPSYVLVRINGLYMFQEWSDKPDDLVLIDLEGAAVDMLTSNRDGFAHQRLRNDVRAFGANLAKERRQALEAKSGIVSVEFVGGERFQATAAEMQEAYDKKEWDARQEAADLLDQLGDMSDGDKAGRLLRSIMQRRGLPPEEQQGYWTGQSDPETLAKMLEGVKITGSSHAEAVSRILAWRPDYLVHNEVSGLHVARRFWPQTMTSEVRRLMKIWAELCRFVMLQLGCPKPFGVGVIFSGSMLAAHKEQFSDKLQRRLSWLLLNPTPRYARYDDATLIDPRKDDQLLNLYAMAIHEATHMADEVSDHDVDFAAALTKNIARTYGQEKRIREIRRSALKYDREVRAEIKEAKRTRAAGPPPPEPTLPSQLDAVLVVIHESYPRWLNGVDVIALFGTWNSRLEPTLFMVADMRDHYDLAVVSFHQRRTSIEYSTWSTRTVYDWVHLAAEMQQQLYPWEVVNTTTDADVFDAPRRIEWEQAVDTWQRWTRWDAAELEHHLQYIAEYAETTTHGA